MNTIGGFPEPRTSNRELIMINGRLDLPPDRVAELCRRYHIKRLSLFGSMARGEARPDSDVDFLAEFEPGSGPSLFGLSELRDELSALAGQREVDIATPAILENPYRRSAILRDLVDIYVAH